VFCKGCTLCFSGKRDKCPSEQYVTPILDAIIEADALVFATPHYGACSMSGAMKTLLDHLDFLVLNVTPRTEIFKKKAFIITTAAGSTAAAKPIKSFLKHWGINRVYSLSFRILTDKWEKMTEAKQAKFEKYLRQSAGRFFRVKVKRPYLSTVFYYHISKFIIKKYVGEGNYPFEYWKEHGFFKKRPF
jgi:multimeric flavodoxin WrbA